MKYRRFFLMIATSTIVMFALMYLNTYIVSHVFWSQTRAWMAILMGATMTVVMLAFMYSMYKNKWLNIGIFIGATIVAGLSLWLVRSQVTVDDSDYLSAMIPHHSIAIMTSSRAKIEDQRVRKLADEIIYAQDKEIAEMKYLLASIAKHGISSTENKHVPPELNTVQAALVTPDVQTLAPQFLTEKEISVALPEGAECAFHYTMSSQPVLAFGSEGKNEIVALQISGTLVRIASDLENVFTSGDVTLSISSRNGAPPAALKEQGLSEADMVLSIGSELETGFSGYLRCA